MWSVRGLGDPVIARSVVLTGACLVLALVTRGERVRACAGGDWDIGMETTFDPDLVGDWPGLAWDPSVATYGGPCTECLAKARSEDWLGYLPGVSAADWKKILESSSDADLKALRAKAAGTATAPRGYATSSLWKVTAKDRVIAALDYVRFARTLEPFMLLDDGYGNRPPKIPPTDLVKQATAGISSPDPFIAQRYAYQAVRLSFYRRDWPMAIRLHDAHAAVLAKPSRDIQWNARHYLAGALLRNGQRGRANLELARIAGNYAPLAGAAVFEFAPKDEADWKEALRLATSVKDKIALWRVVGIRKDGLVGTREILALDPKSSDAALLIVRELTKLEERRPDRSSDWQPDPKDVAAMNRSLGVIEKLALDQIRKGGDRPWLMELIAGHIAAIRGDLATTRARIGRALAAQPNNKRVISQVNASLALAISRNWKVGDVGIETELANSIAKISEFSRTRAVTDEVRDRLAALYLKAGKPAIAEMLKKETITRVEDGKPPPKPLWRDLTFIKDLMARETSPKTPFEQFVAAGTYTKDELQFEIAMRLLFDGEFVGAQAAYDKKRSQKMSQDPFVLKIKDSYDADRAKYRGNWTYASVLARLIELDARVKAGGEAGAEAAILIGNAIYNLTWYGISKWMIEGSHAGAAGDAALAMRYFKKAHDLSSNRELKTRAAYFAAKSELLVRLDDAPDPDADMAPPLPKTWYPILKSYKGTRYYKDVIKECGRFAAWAN